MGARSDPVRHRLRSNFVTLLGLGLGFRSKAKVNSIPQPPHLYCLPRNMKGSLQATIGIVVKRICKE